MIKKMTDDILDCPKERDAKQKSQEETVSARKYQILRDVNVQLCMLTRCCCCLLQ